MQYILMNLFNPFDIPRFQKTTCMLSKMINNVVTNSPIFAQRILTCVQLLMRLDLLKADVHWATNVPNAIRQVQVLTGLESSRWPCWECKLNIVYGSLAVNMYDPMTNCLSNSNYRLSRLSQHARCPVHPGTLQHKQLAAQAICSVWMSRKLALVWLGHHTSFFMASAQVKKNCKCSVSTMWVSGITTWSICEPMNINMSHAWA